MPVRELKFIEIAVPNLRWGARELLQPLGIPPQPIAEGADDWGQPSAAFRHGAANLVLTAPAADDTPAATFLRAHGPGVCDVAFAVDDVDAAFASAVRAGAAAVSEPATWKLGAWSSRRARVRGVDDLIHSFVQPFDEERREHASDGLLAIDHVAICVAEAQLASVIAKYQRAFGFHVSHREQVDTGFTGMTSVVLESANGAVRIPFQAPGYTGAPGQISDFLLGHGGAGVQHIAFLTRDIVETVGRMRERGVSFLVAPSGYYEALAERISSPELELARLRAANVLFDRDESGDLLQIFAKSSHPRRTLFVELIERRASRGFGAGNIRALFQALEREHLARANPSAGEG